MKKTLKTILLILLVMVAICCFVACGSTDNTGDQGGGTENVGGGNEDGGQESGGTESGGSSENQNFTGIVFNDLTIDYDGQEHTIIATGISANASVTYTNAGPFKDAGEYSISVLVKANGYNDYQKTVKLKINKISFPSNIKFEDLSVTYNGEQFQILVDGNLPAGTEVVYENNKESAVGTYNATATLKNKNYIQKTLSAVLTIKEKVINNQLLGKAKEVIDKIMKRPDPWSFLPEAFREESLACSSNPSVNFSTSSSVSNINDKFMGKQMHVLWEGVQGANLLLEKFDVVYAVGETIASAYQNFINDNSEDYAEWSGSVAGFKIKIVLLGQQSKMLVGNNSFALELFADSENNTYKGRIEVLNSGIINYEMTDDSLRFNLSLSIKGALYMKQIDFNRDDDVVTGYYHEYVGIKSVAKKTSATIMFDNEYAIVTSAKRESDDLLIEGYEEVYSSKTGKFLSAEVIETNKLVDFDTYWVSLKDVSGINSVKTVENGNIEPNKNNYDVYVNGAASVFAPKYNKLLFVETSRRFDIEMKDVYYLVATKNGNKISYEVVETKIPMLFIQKDAVSDFGSEAKEMNKSVFTQQPTLPVSKLEIASEYIEKNINTLKTLKEQLGYDELVAQIGIKDSFFTE